MNDTHSRADLALIAELTSGDERAADVFFERFSNSIWRSCVAMTPDESAARQAMEEIWRALKGDGFARLRPYDGASSLDTFVKALVRDLVGMRALRLAAIDVRKYWGDFLKAFDINKKIDQIVGKGSDREDARQSVHKKIDQIVGKGSGREDARQSVHEKLIAFGEPRFRKFSGEANPFGFVSIIVERLTRDFLRSKRKRRRLSAAIERLSPFDQEIYKMVAWEKWSSKADELHRRLGRRNSIEEVEAALERIHCACPAGLEDQGREVPLISEDTDGQLAASDSGIGDKPRTPLEDMMAAEGQTLLDKAAARLLHAQSCLSEEERDVFLYMGEGLKPRDIAAALEKPVESIRRTTENIRRKMKANMLRDQDLAQWLEYVTE